MNIFLYVAIAAAIGFWVNKLFNRIDTLERKVSFLEDRSPQARNLREMENEEKGWGSEVEDVKEILRYVMSVNSAQNFATRALLLEKPAIVMTLKYFCQKYSPENDSQQRFKSELEKIVSSAEGSLEE